MELLSLVGWPVLDRFRIGEFAISPHGIFIAIGFSIGAVLLTRLAPKRGISSEHISTMIFWALVGAIVGSRVGYVIAHVSEFSGPLEWFQIWNGGISLLGGILGAVAVNIPIMRRYGYRPFQVLDPAMVALAMGIGIGRIGDLIIADHLGKPTDFILGFAYRGGTIAPPFSCVEEVCQANLQGEQVLRISREGAQLFGPDGVIASAGGLHQTALYDMIGAWLLFAALWFLWRRRDRLRWGVITCTFGLWYGSMRIVEDFLRIDKRFFGLTGSQWTALTVGSVCAVVLLRWALTGRLRSAGGGGDPPGTRGPSSESEQDAAGV